MIIAKRYHDISCGHRVVGHGTKCRFLHGHNYRITFHLEGEELDHLGMVIDFGVIKSHLCEWLEDNWDHKTLIWKEDPKLKGLKELFPESICVVDFNPTAENMAIYLVEGIAPLLFMDYDVRLTECEVLETRKCSAVYRI